MSESSELSETRRGAGDGVPDNPRDEPRAFDGGPFQRLPLIGGLWLKSGWRRALILGTLAWVPLVILAAVEGNALPSGAPKGSSLLTDVAVYARYLVSLPLLIIAEHYSTPALNRIAHHFGDIRMVSEADSLKYEKALVSTRRLLNSIAALVVMVLLILSQVIFMRRTLGDKIEGSWRMMPGETITSWTYAGWWEAVVSHPLYLMLFYAWLWRLFLWARLLWKISGLNLTLIPCHPDGAGGLGFVGASLVALRLFALGIACTAVGPIANQVLHGGRKLLEFKVTVLGFAVILMALLVGPMLCFIRNLREGRRSATFAYGGLVVALGREFERRWIGLGKSPEQIVDSSALEAPDFSATTDLLQIVEYASNLRLVPFDRKGLITLGIVILAPFGPLLLTEVPLAELVVMLKEIVV